MKTLYVMRHPQKKEDSLEDDFFIPLTKKGIDDANIIANKLKDKSVNIDLIVSSPSLRTETTSMILSNTLDIKKKILYNEVLYQGFLDELIESINFTFNSVEILMIVGHNPLLSNLVNHFVGFKDQINSGQIIKINFETSSWVDISSQNARLIEIIEPNN